MKKQLTAAELLAELQRDPAWRERQVSDDALRVRLSDEFSELERPLLADLSRVGVHASTIGNALAFAPYLPLAPQVVEVLLRWLPAAHWRLKEPIVRLLASPRAPYNGTPLMEEFERTLKVDVDALELAEATALSDLRWAIASTIAAAIPNSISEWVWTRGQDPTLGKSREMLLLAVARLWPASSASQLLREMFDEYPSQCARALGEIGGELDRNFLLERRDKYSKEVRKEISRAIGEIESRGN